jgi:hypothetical protein
VKWTPVAAGSYSSTIVSYKVENANLNSGVLAYSAGASWTSGALNHSGAQTFTLTVTDSRGRTASTSGNITVTNYNAPSIASAAFVRATSGGVIDRTAGTYVNLTAAFAYSNIGTNAITAKAYYKEVGAATWLPAGGVAVTITGTAPNMLGSVTYGTGALLISKLYDVKVALTDAYSTVEVLNIVPTVSRVFDFREGKAAFGGIAAIDKSLQVPLGWTMHVNGNKEVLHEGNYTSYAPTKTGTGASGTWGISVTGNAASATKLTTARTLTIGNKGKTFNGTGNVSWSLAEIGALPLSGGTITGDVIYTHSFQYHAVAGGWARGFGYRTNDGSDYIGFLGAYGSSDTMHYLAMGTTYNDPKGFRWYPDGTATLNGSQVLHASNYNSYAPTKTGTGASGSWGISITGNAATATKLTTARTLTIGSTGKTFNGTGNVSWTLAEIGAAKESHSHGIADLPTITVAKGGTGATTAAAAITNLGIKGLSSWVGTSGNTKTFTVTGNSNTYYPVVISLSTSKVMPARISIWKNLGSTTATYSGNHTNGTSSMWLQYEGRYAGWDGNGGYVKCLYHTMPYAPLCARAYVAGNNAGALVVLLRGGGTEYNISTTESSTINVYYSTTNVSTPEYPVNVSPETSLGNLGVLNESYIAPHSISGNAATATRLATARTLTIGNTGKTFNGTGNVSWSLAEIGALPLSGGTLTGSITLPGSVVLAKHPSYNALRVSNPNGDFQIGPFNTGHCHIYTDRPNFYFNKELMVNGTVVSLNGHTHSYAPLTGAGTSGTWGISITGNAATASNSSKLGGLSLGNATQGSHPGANTVVRTDANGYLNVGWINTVSGSATGTPTRIYCSQDAYLRYYAPDNANLRRSMKTYITYGTSLPNTGMVTGDFFIKI